LGQLALFRGMKTDGRTKPVNVASVPQRSPFRYPGGKTWLVPLFRRWMWGLDPAPRVLIEPFAGGGIISLTAAFEKLADSVVMVERDDNVAAVWESILGGDAAWLASRILSFNLTRESVKDESASAPASRRELAFLTLLRNRTAHGGILAEGAGVLKHGENGKGILSRWYPQTIARRISGIGYVADRIRFIHGDAFAVMTEFRDTDRAAFFVDPPYTAGGKRAGSRLYTHSEVDHERLFTLCESMRGDFLMTYDNAEEVRTLAVRHGFETCPVAMNNTHHAEMTELLIGRDLRWTEERFIVHEGPAPYGVATRRRHKPRASARLTSGRRIEGQAGGVC